MKIANWFNGNAYLYYRTEEKREKKKIGTKTDV